MTQQDKLQKIIEKAVENGWKKPADELWELMHGNVYYAILFDHSFVKAVFGEEAIIYEEVMKNWQYHLQQAVLSEDPITYYYENL